MNNQTKNNNLNYLIDPTFSKLNRLFVLSFKNEEDKTITNAVTKYFSEYFTPSVEIKDFNVLINEKSFFDTSIKHKEESYEQIIEMGRNNDYTTSNLLDYEYFSKHCRLIVIDLSKQIELGNHDLKQKINFIERIEMDEGATMFFITGKSEETNFEFTQNSSTIV